MPRKAPPAHFDLNNQAAYQAWRSKKLAHYPATIEDLKVSIHNPAQLSTVEQAQLQTRLDRYNMAIYACQNSSENKQIPLRIAKTFELKTLDANIGADIEKVTSIQVKKTGVHGRYIPYTDAKLSWHTDGYYSLLSKQIRGMMLHCVRPAKSGGENELLDPEMAYLYLRDLNPEYISALSEPDAMIIPANEVDGKIIRAEQSGPVFSHDENGYLHMRYSARKKNIVWKNNPTTTQAAEHLSDLCASDSPWIIRGTLAAGEGLICNNVLHNRGGFMDDKTQPRLLYRLRYYERVATEQA